MSQQECPDMVGQPPIVLFGHRPVEAAQPCLDVADRNVQLHRGERAGERRVHVARDDDEVRPELDEDALEPREGASCLLAVRGGPHLELVIGSREG